MRFPLLFCVLWVLFVLGWDLIPVWGQCRDDQTSLLLRLKEELMFNPSSSTKLVGWNRIYNCSQWGGVTWEGGRVVGLDLSSESISEGINSSSSLFDLQFLRSLNLAYNRFHSKPIPPGFDKLSNLKYLNFSNAGFEGQIPIEISRLTRLVTLDFSTLCSDTPLLKLENPNLTMLVRNLAELTELRLDCVNFSSQRYEWCQVISSWLPNLRVLSLSGCRLSGPIDSSLQKLRNLSEIVLSGNNLSTTVPGLFANFTNLTSLRLSSCGLSGTFLPEIFLVPTLRTLDISMNRLLSGSLPELPQNSPLQTLVLSQTNFSGKLPDSIDKLEMLSRIELNNCSFYGIIPNSIANLTRLAYLDFSVNQFTGSIPSFHKSRNLSYVSLSHNNLTGLVPSINWEGLKSLVNLDLAHNSLDGSIPSSLFRLPALKKILLSNNHFDGIEAELSKRDISPLDTLDLSSNKLSGQIPRSFFELRSLSVLSLSSNNFSDTLPFNEIGKLKNLTQLDLSYNSLSIMESDSNSTSPSLARLKLASCNLTAFPDLRNQSRLVYLDLSGNKIAGRIPTWIWAVGNGSLLYLNLSHNLLVSVEKPYVTPNLSVLDLHSNQLGGEIPILPEYAAYLDYSRNNFSSSIPAGIGNSLPFAIFISLSSNKLFGSIPESLCNANFLEVLNLSNNSLSGGIPPCLVERIKSLGVLNLQRNNLSGNIPKNFPLTCSLETLDLNGNVLEGQIPKSLSYCKKLQVLNLGNNMINDMFPCWLKNVSSLRVLILRSNAFHGSINCSKVVGSWKNLQIIDIASNHFNGVLPPLCVLYWKGMMSDMEEVKHLRFDLFHYNSLYYQDAVTVTSKGLEMNMVKILTVFTAIDFSNNKFHGQIPDTIGNLTLLYVLNLSRNSLSGQIPSSVGNLRQIESLDLSQNQLSGKIPEQLANLTFLSFLNLSYNKLWGPIPSGTQLQTFSVDSFEGNNGLCGHPLNATCPNSGGSSSRSQKPRLPMSNEAAEFDWQFIFTGLGFGLGVGMVLAPLMFWKKGRKWYSQHIDKCLPMVFPSLAVYYAGYDDERVEAEELIGTELTEIIGDFDCEEPDETEEDEETWGRFCVFCSKLDFTKKKVIHNLKCSCYESSPISSSFSPSSSSSSSS